jgi:spore maturation protein SpmB
MLALLPNLLGATLMTWLGDRNEAARLPVIWALAGGLACAVPVMLIRAGSPDTHSAVLVAFTFTGACCALICHYRIEW